MPKKVNQQYVMIDTRKVEFKMAVPEDEMRPSSSIRPSASSLRPHSPSSARRQWVVLPVEAFEELYTVFDLTCNPYNLILCSVFLALEKLASPSRRNRADGLRRLRAGFFRSQVLIDGSKTCEVVGARPLPRTRDPGPLHRLFYHQNDSKVKEVHLFYSTNRQISASLCFKHL